MVASPAKYISTNTKIALVDDNGDVLCWHGNRAVKRTSTTIRHPGRVFWACSIYKGEEGHCDFFKWDNELPPHNNPADPSLQWHPPAPSSQSTQSSQGAPVPLAGPSSQPVPVSASPTQSQPSSQTQPSSQPPPSRGQGYPTPSTPPRNKRPLSDTGSPSPSRIPKRTMPPPGVQARTPRHERLRAKIEAFLGPDGTSPPPAPAPAFGGPSGPTQPAETTYGFPYAAPGVPYDLAPPPPPSTYASGTAPQPSPVATGFERRGGSYTQRSNASAADAAAVERLVSALGTDHTARESAVMQRVRNARSVQTDPSSEFGDEVDLDADMDSDAGAIELFAAKGKERERAEELEVREFFNPGSSFVGAGPSSVTSTTASSESIADMINCLGGIPAYVSKLERQVTALQKGSEAKARRIKDLLDENERLKKDKTRMRAALRLAVADFDEDSAKQGDDSVPSGSGQH